MGKTKIKPFDGLESGYKHLYQEILTYIDYWKPVLGLEHWEFFLKFKTTEFADNPNVRARVRPLWEYRVANFDFYLPALAEDSKRERETDVVHEMVHCLTCAMTTKKTKRQLEEMVVVDTTKAFMRLKYPKEKV